MSCLGKACTVQHRNPHCRGGRNKNTLSNQLFQFEPGAKTSDIQTGVDVLMACTKRALLERMLHAKEPITFSLTLTEEK